MTGRRLFLGLGAGSTDCVCCICNLQQTGCSYPPKRDSPTVKQQDRSSVYLFYNPRAAIEPPTCPKSLLQVFGRMHYGRGVPSS